MQRSEYQAALQGPNLNQIIQALNSDYIPSTPKDFQLLVEITRIGYPPIQDLLLKHIESIPNDKALPVYIALVKYSHSENAVSQALNIVCEFENPEVTDAIIIATFNANVDIQLKAVRFLTNKDSDHLVEVLLDRIDYPDRAAPHADSNHQTQIRRQSIESIGASGRVELIEKLVDLAANSNELRHPVKESLIRINHQDLGTYLLDLFYNNDRNMDQSPEFRFFCAEVLGEIDLNDEQVVEYLPILQEVYDETLRSRINNLNGAVAKYFDELGNDFFIERIHRVYQDNVDALNMLFNAVSEIPFQDTIDLWSELFNTNQRPVLNCCTRYMNRFFDANFEQMCNSFAQLVMLLKHHNEANTKNLLQMVGAYDLKKKKGLTESIIPLLGDAVEENVGPLFLQEMWKALGDEHKLEVFQIWMRNYCQREEVRANFEVVIRKAWHALPADDVRRELYPIIIEFTNDHEYAVARLLSYLLSSLPDSSLLFCLVLEDLLDEEGHDNHSVLLDSLTDTAANSREIRKTIVEALNTNDFPQEFEVDLTCILLELLGEFADTSDVELIGSFISNSYDLTIQVTAVNTLQKFQTDSSESTLIEKAIFNRENEVVKAAICSAGTFLDTQSEITLE